MDHVQVFIGENLTMESDIVQENHQSLQLEFDDLVMIVDNPEAADSNMVLRDELHQRQGAYDQRRLYAALRRQRLAIKPGDVVYDVGAGTVL